jgi:hypothetical protein
MAAGAVGASTTPEDDETDDPLLTCLFDVLGLRSMDPDRAGRVADGGIATRVVPPLWVTFGRSAIFSFSAIPLDSRMLPSPVGEGNWVSLKSVEADSRLLCRSSKLTDGRKS